MSPFFLFLSLIASPQWGEEVKVEYVIIPVQVMDHQGRPVTLLNKRDFALEVDLRSVPIEMFHHDFLSPISLYILLDGSGSMKMGDRWDRAQRLIQQTLLQTKDDDELGMTVFSSTQQVELVPFPGDPYKILQGFKSIEPGGKTALFDALTNVASYFLRAQHLKKALFVITDGKDNQSLQKPENVREILTHLEVPVYIFLLPLTPLEPIKRERFQSLAESTGGRLYVITSTEKLSLLVASAISELRHQYLLGFAPSHKGGVKYHRISIHVRGNWKVRHRKGYTGRFPEQIYE